MIARRFHTKPRLAVVGLGYWGPNLVRVLFERTDVEVRWLCDTDPDRLEKIGRRYPSALRTQNLDEILLDASIDGVVLATPVFSHFDLAMRCMEAGKHVFVEKPLAPCTEHATQLIDYATRQDLSLVCGHTFLYSPPVRAVKDLIDDGELGDIYFISASRVNLGLHQRDISVIWDLGPHDFSIILYWLGNPPEVIQATGRDSIVPGVADVAFVNMQFESGLIANVELSWLAPSKLRRTVIVGSKKMVVYEDGAAESIKIFDRGAELKDPTTFGEWQMSYRTGDIRSPHLPTHEPLALQAGAFVESIRTGEVPEHGLALARDVVRLAEGATASLDNGGVQIELGESSILTA